MTGEKKWPLELSDTTRAPFGFRESPLQSDGQREVPKEVWCRTATRLPEGSFFKFGALP